MLDSETMTLEEQLHAVEQLPANELLQAASSYNWDMYPVEVLGRIAGRQDCSLLTALTIFELATPTYYDQESAAQDGDIVTLLQTIQDRINAGKYSHDQADHDRGWQGLGEATGLVRAKVEGHRWHLDPSLVLPALELSEDQKDAREDQRLAWIEREAAKQADALVGAPRARVIAEKMLPLTHVDIQKRVDALMLGRGLIQSIKWRRSATRRTLLKRVAEQED